MNEITISLILQILRRQAKDLAAKGRTPQIPLRIRKQQRAIREGREGIGFFDDASAAVEENWGLQFCQKLLLDVETGLFEIERLIVAATKIFNPSNWISR